MKKIFCVWMLCFSASLWASSNDQLIIKIHNLLATDCELQEQIVLYGHVSDHTKVPTVIPAQQTAQFTMRSGPHHCNNHDDKTILLTYVCGSEQSITLYTTDKTWQNPKTFDEKNMRADFKMNTLMLYPSEIYWTLMY